MEFKPKFNRHKSPINKSNARLALTIRRVLNDFDEWNDESNAFPQPHGSDYFNILLQLEDAVVRGALVFAPKKTPDDAPLLDFVV